MKHFYEYTNAQIKRSSHYLPFIFIVTFVICSALAILLLTLVNGDSSDADKQKLRIGITGSYEDTYIGFGLTAIQSFDSSRFALELIEMNEDEAMVSLKSGDIAGFVSMPENFIDDAVHGHIGKLSFVTNYVNADIVNMFKQEVLELVSTIIVESQKGVYAMQDTMYEAGANTSEINDETLALSTEYINLTLNRTNALEIKIIGVSDNLSFSGYMFSGLSILLILFTGIVTAPLYIRNDVSLYKLLSANRCKPISQISGEYISFFITMLINNSLLIFTLMLVASKLTNAIPELFALNISSILISTVKFIPAIALITSFQFFMYQISDSIVSGVLMQFLAAALLGYISGCFYPINFFPGLIQNTSNFIPSGIARVHLASIITENIKITHTITMLLYFTAFISLSVFVRDRKIKAS